MFTQQIEQRSARIEPQLVDRAVYLEFDINHRSWIVCGHGIRRLRAGKTHELRSEGERGAGARDLFQKTPAGFEAAKDEQLVERIAGAQ